MARIARIVVPNVPYHVTGRGNDGQWAFLRDGVKYGVPGITLAVGVTQFPSYFLGQHLAEGDVVAAKQFCETTLLPRIHAYHAVNGSYPLHSQEILHAGDQLPRLLKDNRDSYHSNGKEFSICFEDRRGRHMFDHIWEFTSRSRNWIVHS